MKATRRCTVPGCDRKHKGHGLCDLHRQRLARTGTTDSPVRTLAERFWEKVDKRGPDECWLWTAAKKDGGYGVMRPEGQRSGPTIKAHRVSLLLAGVDIEGKVVRHRCDNPPCVNPAHLETGTQAENCRDTSERGRHVGAARLAPDDVRAIRRRLAAGDLHRVVAAAFGVARSTISAIAEGKAWRRVT